MSAVGAITYFQTLKGAGPLFGVLSGPWLLLLGFALLLYTFYGWWRDVVKESVTNREHTPVVKLGLRYGMIL
ncbi:MAG: cytochrome c oxidase subunit 3, partial [Planctomycetota bacterium]